MFREMLGHQGRPPSLWDSRQGPGSPLPLLLGASVCKVGVWSEQSCPIACQEDSSSHVDRMRASDGSTTSRLRVPVRAEGPGPWPWTAQIPLGQGGGPRVGQLWPRLRQSTVASIPTAWGMQPGQGPSLPLQPQAHSQAPRRPGQQLLLCSAVRAAQVLATHQSALHTHVSGTLLHASSRTGGGGGDTPMRGTSRALWGHLSCLYMNVLGYWGQVSAKLVWVWQP